jgi:hypothetical protein
MNSFCSTLYSQLCELHFYVSKGQLTTLNVSAIKISQQASKMTKEWFGSQQEKGVGKQIYSPWV